MLSLPDDDAVVNSLAVIADLVANPTLVLVVAPRFPKRIKPVYLAAADLARSSSAFADVGAKLISSGVAWVRCPRDLQRSSSLAYSRRLAERLRFDKLVVCDARGGIEIGGRKRSFINARSLERLISGHSRSLGTWRRAELRELVGAAVGGDGPSVNLTTVEGLEEELFTYEGSGTLITLGEYCEVDKLGAGDFVDALGLLRRGEREGFLLARSEQQRIRLLLTGYGAWFENDRLAGVASLETDQYLRTKLGEIRGLYAITRFAGEGVGKRIVAHLVAEGRRLGLKALFACTANARAASFFERGGFEQVPESKLPRRKWREGPKRKKKPLVFWLDL